MSTKCCFVTVGSTQSNHLITAVLSDEFLKILHSLGLVEMLIQCGAGEIPAVFSESANNGSENEFNITLHGININMFRYKSDLSDDMSNAALIIGHAGAGTCIEALELGKPMIAVINESLMDNHQSDLAEKLAEEGHLICTTPNKLIGALGDKNLFNPVPFLYVFPDLFHSYMRNVVDSL